MADGDFMTPEQEAALESPGQAKEPAEDKRDGAGIADKCQVCDAKTSYKDTGNWEVWECPEGHGAWLLTKSPKPFWKADSKG